MKFARPLVSVLSLLLGCVAHAQTPPAAAASPAPAAKVVVKGAPVAWINTASFVDENAGIKALVRVNKELELEFSGQQGDLSLLQEKLRTIVTEMQTLRAGGEANAAAIQQKQQDGLKLRQELETKGQQFQAAVQQAQQEKQGPIANELSKAIAAYIKDHDIGIVIDVSKMGEAIAAAKPELDITEDFVAHYNASHP
jgi:Skp family chaperone for outer membrane proteins